MKLINTIVFFIFITDLSFASHYWIDRDELNLDNIGKYLDAYDRHEGDENMQSGFAFAMLKECYPEEQSFDTAKRRFFAAEGKTTKDVYSYFRKLYDDASTYHGGEVKKYNANPESFTPEQENELLRRHPYQAFLKLNRKKSSPEEIRAHCDYVITQSLQEIRIRQMQELIPVILKSIGILAILVGLVFMFYKTENKSIGILFVITSLALLAGSLFPQRHLFDGYYMLLRVITSAVCVYSVIKFKTEWTRWGFGVLAVLYNPVLLVHFGEKDLWAIINLATVVFLWIALYTEQKNRKNGNKSIPQQ